MSRHGYRSERYYKAPGGKRKPVRNGPRGHETIHEPKLGSRIQDTCHVCGRVTVAPPWFTECAICQARGCDVRGGKIGGAR